MKNYTFTSGLLHVLTGYSLGLLVGTSISDEGIPLTTIFAGVTLLFVIGYVMFETWKTLKVLTKE
jgi:hypothetical protein